MSGKLVGMVFDYYPNGGSELLLAVKLADNAHDPGTHIFPSVATLATQTRQSERTVQYQLKRMLAMGWLQLVSNEGGGRGRAREYRIDPVWIAAHDSKTPESERPTWAPRQNPAWAEKGANIAPFSEAERVQPDAQKGATAIAQKGATAIAPEPSLTVIEPNTPQPPTGGARGFEKFIAAYPRKKAKDKARREWDLLAPDEGLQRTMLAAVAAQRQSQDWRRDGGRYIPLPWKWLRGRRWTDETEASEPARPVGPDPALAKIDRDSLRAVPPPPEVKRKMAELLGSAGRRKAA